MRAIIEKSLDHLHAYVYGGETMDGQASAIQTKTYAKLDEYCREVEKSRCAELFYQIESVQPDKQKPASFMTILTLSAVSTEGLPTNYLYQEVINSGEVANPNDQQAYLNRNTEAMKGRFSRIQELCATVGVLKEGRIKVE